MRYHMLPKSKVLIDLINRRAYRNSRCSRDTYKDIHLTERAVRKKNIQWIFLALGQLEVWEIDVEYIEEKSGAYAKASAPACRSHSTNGQTSCEKQRPHKVGKD